MDFTFYALRFDFRAQDLLYFPGQAANTLRGAFGTIFRTLVPEDLYRSVFEPSFPPGKGPSGLRDWPRPFVFRASHLDGRKVLPGEPFHFGINLFQVSNSLAEQFRLTFAELATAGVGPCRGRARLVSCQGAAAPLVLSLDPEPDPVHSLRVEFVTPAELKGVLGTSKPLEFAGLFGRIRDRVSSLRALYGAGPLPIDFKEIGKRAATIRLSSSDIRSVAASRRSSRTGQVHGIGGFTGWAEYTGALGEFVPFLRAAAWCGVGRQCVWGKGELRVKTGIEMPIR